MDPVWWAWGTACVALLAVALLAVALRRAREGCAAAQDRARTEVDGLLARVEHLERTAAASAAGPGGRADASVQPEPGTDPLPASAGPAQPEVIEATRVIPSADPLGGRLFADLALRETVVVAASWVHGVRRALRPEARNRMAFAMRQEVKRSRRQRKADLREARRQLRDDLRARERAA
jgi:hypothetical protein